MLPVDRAESPYPIEDSLDVKNLSKNDVDVIFPIPSSLW